jgi:hypothetical protein
MQEWAKDAFVAAGGRAGDYEQLVADSARTEAGNETKACLDSPGSAPDPTERNACIDQAKEIFAESGGDRSDDDAEREKAAVETCGTSVRTCVKDTVVDASAPTKLEVDSCRADARNAFDRRT